MNGTLRFANSWGPEWGDHGFGSMSMDVAEKMIDSSQMWAVEAHVDR
jgi:C1A family cysteine protease